MNIQKKDHKKGREKGFTLIEVLVAIAILSFGILAIASMQSSALLGTGRSNSVTQANAIATDRLERLMAMPYSRWGPSFSDQSGGDEIFGATTVPTHGSITNVQWDVSPTGATTNTISIWVTVQSRDLGQDIVLRGLKTQVSDL